MNELSIIIIFVIIMYPIYMYIMNRIEPIEDIEKTVDGKIFKITRDRRWFE